MHVERQKSRVPNLTVIIIVFMVALAGLMMLHQVSRAENIVSPVEILLGTPQGPSGAIQAFTRHPVTVYMPPNATAQAGTIAISLASTDLALVADDSGWARSHVVSVEFQDPNGTPLSGTSFSPPLEICFELTAEQWRDFQAQTDAYEVQHFVSEVDPPGWETLPQKTYPARRQLCGQTTHLSLFSLATILEVPVTGPTGSGAMSSTLVPTRTAIPSIATHQRRQDGASSEGGLLPGPTSIAPTNPASTPVPPQPTQVPTNEVPPTEVPTQEPPPDTPEPPPDTPEPPPDTPEPPPAEAPSLLDPILTLIAPP